MTLNLNLVSNQSPLVNQREESNLDDINYLKQYISFFQLIYPDRSTAVKTNQNKYIHISAQQLDKFSYLPDSWLLQNDEEIWANYPKINQQLIQNHKYVLEKKRVISLNICKYSSEFIYETISYAIVSNECAKTLTKYRYIFS